MTALLQASKLRVSLQRGDAAIDVVKGIDLDLQAGEILGLAGESGSGKSMTALALMGLLKPPRARVQADRLMLNGLDLQAHGGSAYQQVRGKRMAMIFQDPSTALDPVFTVGWQLSRTIARSLGISSHQAHQRALSALEGIGFEDGKAVFSAYPHELSGGMKQLSMIAMATAIDAEVLIADEPTTALDVCTQATVLRRLRELRENTGMAILFISHDLGAIAQTADRCLVMYDGRIVEQGQCKALFSRPHHPYTAGLLQAIPRLDRAPGDCAVSIPGQVPAVGEDLPGCAFAPRCSRCKAECTRSLPELLAIDDKGLCACHHPL